MGQQDLSNFLNKHCHFRFRGGKEAFGVIWMSNGSLVFSSKEYHLRVKENRVKLEQAQLLTIDSDDVMMAEVIV
ncbi:MAG: hypothetical protein HKN45_10565 [Flavobacteriales bacterium]|nr:hypothetical protein [Flavobacteriales bacterium]NNK81217.1 hypothetical protein [Flavobacteriales bacterium]